MFIKKIFKCVFEFYKEALIIVISNLFEVIIIFFYPFFKILMR